MEKRQIIQNSIISDMSEGVMAIRFDGRIELVNDAALSILERTREELEGRPFASCFFINENNDPFTECVLDVIYMKGRRQDRYVPYHTDRGRKELRIVSSYLKEESEKVGVILVISDITELTRMRDAVIAMEKIRRLNESLSLRNRVLQETFGRYLSDDIVREILESPDGWKLGGQKRTLTIMMSDIRGFTMLCERMEPQDLVTMVNHYFSEMYEEISRYNGTLIEFLGDGMFVISGAPVTTQAHASDAVAAAIGMLKRMKAVNEWNAQRGFEPLSMGIAINSDDVILGNIGSERRTKYGVLGAPVNLTGRLESYAAGGQILISSSTRDLIREEVTVDFTRNVSPKGVHGDITICGVSGIGAPYNLYLDEKTDRPVLLPAPAEVKYYLLDGKHVIGRSRKAAILSVSEGQAVMETEEEIFTCDNLKLDVGDGLYALVTHTENDLTTIRFTARPAGFGQWLEQIGFREPTDNGDYAGLETGGKNHTDEQ
jgi:adenylate cyclase